MGGGHSHFTQEELIEYQELTYLTQKEILYCWKRFVNLDPEKIDRDHKGMAKLSNNSILQLPELKSNPFRDRICRVFSTSHDGDMTFEDFLDMMSVFSENAPRAVKIEYAFRIYDFNEDDFICEKDMRRTIESLCGRHRLTNEHLDMLVEKIMNEADLDEDKQLNFSEFEHVIEKAPDFVHSFRFRI